MSPSEHESKHALVIDDNKSNVEVIAALLEVEGVKVSSFMQPERAAAALPELKSIDVVFCDLEMPRINGYEMLTRLRAVYGQRVPVIAYTVHTSEIEQARKRGFDGFLGKPLDGDRFSSLLEKILHGQQVWEQA